MLKKWLIAQSLIKKWFSPQPFSPVKACDESLILVVTILLSFSLIMVYSASVTVSELFPLAKTPYYFLIRHFLFIGIAVTMGYIAFLIPIRWWEKQATFFFMVALLLLIMVLVPGIGHKVNGSRRWISLFFFNFQPSECMKLACIIYTASYLVRHRDVLSHIKKGFGPILLIMLFLALTLLWEPDFGAFVVIIAIMLGLLFLGGMHMLVFIGSIGLTLGSMVLLIITAPYRMRRLIGFIDPFDDPFDKGYQLSNSLIAFGLGKWFGVGLGAGVQKLAYLPEPHTDFILSVIAEEFGVIGICTLIILYAFIVLRAFCIAQQAKKLESDYSALVAQGIGMWIGLQAFCNMGVSMGILPTKGMTMPFMSFGGSAMVFNLIAICVLLRVDWENRRIMRGYKAKR